MDFTNRQVVLGSVASPYTRKMLALLRYRHIAHTMIWTHPSEWLDEKGIENPKVVLLPVFLMPQEDGKPKAVCDSTPIIRDLEARHEGRSVIPTDPAVAFLDYLMEDYADEWGTRFMFHYRWQYAPDIEYAGTQLPLMGDVSMPDELHKQAKAIFSERQISRLYVVGSSETTAPVIEAAYQRLLSVLDDHIGTQPFMLGHRPGASDFAFMGQLTQLVGFDPTPRAIAQARAPRVVAWTSVMEDQSGLALDDASWNTADTLPDTLRPLFVEIGKTYVPTMIANAKAVMAGETQWGCEVDGALWQQPTFSYQAKCLGWVRGEFEKLTSEQRSKVRQFLDGTGCEGLFADITG